MAIMDALPVLYIRKPTKEEMEDDSILTTVLTADAPWRPSDHHRDLESIILATETQAEKGDFSQDFKVEEDSQDPQETPGETGEDFVDAQETFSVASSTIKEGYETAYESEEEDFGQYYFDPSNDISAKALKGKAVPLSIDSFNKHIRESDIHALLLELHDDVLFGHTQEFDSITYAKGMCNQIETRILPPLEDSSEFTKPGEDKDKVKELDPSLESIKSSC